MNAPSASRESVGGAVAAAMAELTRAGVSEARANAELLLAHLLDTDRGWLFVHRREQLAADVAQRYAGWIARRAAREPLQHITGEQEFHGLSFATDGRALVPRPETEGVVDAVLALGLPRGARVADLGTGGGCIGVTLAVKRPDLEIFALDASHEALDLARENARRLGAEHVHFLSGDLASPPADWHGRIDVVVSNPPYGSATEWETLEPEVRDHDPRSAFVAGPTGLEAYAALARPAFGSLRSGGHLVLELGAGQSEAVSGIVGRAGFDVLVLNPDFQGIARVLVARKRPEALP